MPASASPRAAGRRTATNASVSETASTIPASDPVRVVDVVPVVERVQAEGRGRDGERAGTQLGPAHEAASAIPLAAVIVIASRRKWPLETPNGPTLRKKECGATSIHSAVKSCVAAKTAMPGTSKRSARSRGGAGATAVEDHAPHRSRYRFPPRST